jgi:hypothetical protein
MIIKLSNSEIKKCEQFSHDVVHTNIDKYRERNQTDIDKIVNDIYVGKLCEYAVFKLLKSKNKSVNEPDLKVYSARRKSFSADLTDGKFQYHVKGMKQETAIRFGLSWSFQVEDKLVKFPTDNDVLVLCEIAGNDVDIKTIIKAKDLSELYTFPKLAKLKHIKRVLMWDDIYNKLRSK